LLTALNHLEKNKNNNNHLDLKRIKIKYIGGERIGFEKREKEKIHCEREKIAEKRKRAWRPRENREKRERRKHRKEKRPTSGIRYVFIFAHLLSLTHYIFIA